MTRATAVDLFCGAGGLSLGLEQAGFDIVAGVEMDPIHAAIHKFNFPYGSVVPQSVVGLSGATIRQVAGLGKRRVDLVVGGPPCQGFSLIGHRALDDPRNSLVREFVRIVCELDAPYFLFENVKGLTVGNQRRFLDELIDEFRGFDYDVNRPLVLNASHYGVPQDRERLFLIGAKRGLPLPKCPEESTRPAATGAELLAKPEGPSCKDALDDIPDADKFAELIESDCIKVNNWHRQLSQYAQQMRCDGSKDWHFGYRRRWDSTLLTNSMRTEHTAISRRRFSETQPGTVEPISRFFRLSAEGVSNTLRAGTDSARGAFTSPRPIHYRWPRCVTVREMARLHGFPDWFRFHATKWHGARQIGNAVAPPLARRLGSEFLSSMNVVSVPDKSLDLGEERLLRMGMTEAAQYWGIPVPIGRRDRKSGARKRKQEDIEIARLAASEVRGTKNFA